MSFDKSEIKFRMREALIKSGYVGTTAGHEEFIREGKADHWAVSEAITIALEDSAKPKEDVIADKVCVRCASSHSHSHEIVFEDVGSASIFVDIKVWWLDKFGSPKDKLRIKLKDPDLFR